MKKIKKLVSYVKDNILEATIFFIAIVIVIGIIIAVFDLMYMQWLYVTFAIIILLGIICGIFQFINKIKEHFLKMLVNTIFVIVAMFGLFIIYLFTVFSYTPAHIVEYTFPDGSKGKYVAYVDGFVDTYVKYYKYINPFVVSSNRVIEEYYGNGGFDPIENKNKHEVISTTFYDDSGENIISSINNKEINENEVEDKSENNTENINTSVEKYNNTNISNQSTNITDKVISGNSYKSGKISRFSDNSIFIKDENNNEYEIEKLGEIILYNGRTNDKMTFDKLSLNDFLFPFDGYILVYRNLSGDELKNELLINFTIPENENKFAVNSVGIKNIKKTGENSGIVTIEFSDLMSMEDYDKLEKFTIDVLFNENTKYASKGNNITDIDSLENARYNINSMWLNKDTMNNQYPEVTLFDSSDS